MKRHQWFVIGMILSFASCKDNTVSTTVLDSPNSPVTTSVPNSFTYSINANLYSGNSQNDLSFLSDSLVITLSASGYSSGQAIISVSDSSNATIFSDTVRTNTTIAIAHLKATKPKHCNLSITNLTARLSFVLIGQ